MTLPLTEQVCALLKRYHAAQAATGYQGKYLERLPTVNGGLYAAWLLNASAKVYPSLALLLPTSLSVVDYLLYLGSVEVVGSE